MRYKLTRTRYLAVVGEMPTSKEFAVGTHFIKQGEDGGMVFMDAIDPIPVMVCVPKDAFRDDFETDWGDTRLFGGGGGTETS